MQAIDEIVPTLLHALEEDETAYTALDGLKQILRFPCLISLIFRSQGTIHLNSSPFPNFTQTKLKIDFANQNWINTWVEERVEFHNGFSDHEAMLITVSQ